MKLSATFAVLAVLAAKTFVSALPLSYADDMDLVEMRDDSTDVFEDVLARDPFLPFPAMKSSKGAMLAQQIAQLARNSGGTAGYVKPN
ncbi:hypothetical protein H1R20_g5581, partial [Candolleomyces eurysporus]